MPWKQALQPNILTFLYSNISDLKGRDDEGGRGYENDEKGHDTAYNFIFFYHHFCIFYIFVSLTSKVEIMKVVVDMRTMRRDRMA